MWLVHSMKVTTTIYLGGNFMDKSRMTKKLFASVLVACFLFTSLMGCEAQNEKKTSLRMMRMKSVQKFYRNRILL